MKEIQNTWRFSAAAVNESDRGITCMCNIVYIELSVHAKTNILRTHQNLPTIYHVDRLDVVEDALEQCNFSYATIA